MDVEIKPDEPEVPPESKPGANVIKLFTAVSYNFS